LGSGVSDGTNLYFTDNGSPQLILQEPLAGGPPTKLYSYARPIENTFYSLLGSDGSLLVMSSTSTRIIYGRGSMTGLLATLPIGTLSANTTPLPTNSGFFTASPFMVETTPGTPSTALVFVSTEVGSHRGGPPPSYSSQVLTPRGTEKPGGAGSSAFIYDGTSGLFGHVLQVGSLAYQGAGPWTLSALNLETLASKKLQTPPGPTFTVPAGRPPQLVRLSNLIGTGAYAGPGVDASPGLAYDLFQNLLVPIVIPNTNVAPF
jgi:hypothetical protein